MKVLVAEDDPKTRHALAKRLAQLGHTAEVADSTDSAVHRLEIEEFDLVLAELKTARTDGLRLLSLVRSRHPAIPFVAIFGPSSLEPSVPVEKAGGLAQIRPPFRAERLRRLLRRVESQRAAHPLAEGKAVPGTPPAHGQPPSTARLVPPNEPGLVNLAGNGTEERAQNVLRIDAGGAPPELIGRLLVGSYITGQDRVHLTARRGLSSAQRAVVHRTADRILGMTVVEDTGAELEVQNFVDPARYELPRLLHRVVRILENELEVCRQALTEVEPPSAEFLESMEEEVDRLYFLMARQLLLSSDSPALAHRVNLDSHHYQLGYRLVAKVIEVIGDLIFGVGQELNKGSGGLHQLPASVRKELAGRVLEVENLLNRTMQSFSGLSSRGANNTLDDLGKAMALDPRLLERLAGLRVPHRRLAMSAQRIAWNLSMMMEMLVIVNEVTINRCVEPETVARMSPPPPPPRAEVARLHGRPRRSLPVEPR